MNFWRKLEPRCALVHVLVCLFGCGTWITITGVWVEMPILVEYLPESWDLGAYLSVVIQLANVGPLVYSLVHILYPNFLSEKCIVYLIVGTGIATSALLAVFWKETTVVAGKPHSTALLVLQFFSAMANSTSSVVFLPFMYLLKPVYLMTFYVGQGFSGFLPSILGLAQGSRSVTCTNVSYSVITGQGANHTISSLQPVYQAPNFSPSSVFSLLSAMCGLCGISFALLNHLPICKSQHVNYDLKTSPTKKSPSSEKTALIATSKPNTYNVKWRKNDAECIEEIGKLSEHTLSGTESAVLLVAVGWVKAMENGLIPALQSYAFLPYGMEPYSLAIDLAYIADPSVCFLASFFPPKTPRTLVLLTLLATLCMSYIVMLASLSPSPPLSDWKVGEVLAVMSQVLTTSFLTYAKVSIARVFREEGKRSLFWCGLASQAGAFSGAAIMFVLVSVLEIFEKAPNCSAANIALPEGM
ncbi:riboflavin transporter 2-like [Liolophura sinensis]|uniref:riboflavin transporter 2-like n=1 Tax=Liolophura sinensis TaxID=3198878 RepID=UPI003158424C